MAARFSVRCPGEAPDLQRTGGARMLPVNPGQQVVAHMCFSVLANNDCRVSTSESLKDCENDATTDHLKERLRTQHMDHLRAKQEQLQLMLSLQSSQAKNNSDADHVQPSESVKVDGPMPANDTRATRTKKTAKVAALKLVPAEIFKSIESSPQSQDVPGVIQLPTLRHDVDMAQGDTTEEDSEPEPKPKPELKTKPKLGIVPSYTKTKQIQHTFKICDEEKVIDIMTRILSSMQQTAVKRLAKAWIRGLCPKKQAKYPYHNKSMIPEWWPPLDSCPYVEPDHVRKDERLNLCVHLLRLRPAKEALLAWNDKRSAPDVSHYSQGWTEFLRCAAPPEILTDMHQTRAANAAKRIDHLRDLYTIADKEERYLEGGIDAEDTHTWLEIVDNSRHVNPCTKVLRPAKRVRQPIDGDSDADFEAEPVKPPRTRKKREPKKPVEVEEVPSNSSDPDAARTVIDESAAPSATTSFASSVESASSYTEPYHYIDTSAPTPLTGLFPGRASNKPAIGSWGNLADNGDRMNTSFSSNYSSYHLPSTTSSFVSEANHTPVIGTSSIRPGFMAPHLKQEEQVFSMHEMTQPQFVPTVPNSPVMSPTTDINMMQAEAHALPLSAFSSTSWLNNRPSFTFATAGARPNAPVNSFTMAGTHDHPIAFLEGTRTLANSPVEMAPTTTLSNPAAMLHNFGPF